ncbi:MAG: hypothetical protein ACYCPS_03680 [Candidatus Saccharimonadales bacterium]
MKLILTIVIVIIVLLINEVWWRVKKPNDEISRKAVHIVIGTYVAFWPYYLSWLDIELLGIAFFLVVYIYKKLKLFKTIPSAQRPTWGELFFALAVAAVAVITHDKLIYTTAILTMGLADGLAAIIGAYFGKATNYNILGYTKSLVGSFTFFVVVSILLFNYSRHISNPHAVLAYIMLALASAALENFSVLGLDNLFVPLLITLCLR